MFTNLSITNFRALGPRALKLRLAPLTVLVGENGTGKSSILEALALTAQSAVEDPTRAELIVSGSRVALDFSDSDEWWAPFRALYHGRDASQPMSVGFETSLAAADCRRLGLSESPPELLGDARPWPPTRVAYEWSRVGEREAEWTHKIKLGRKPIWYVDAPADGSHGPTLYGGLPTASDWPLRARLPSFNRRVLTSSLLPNSASELMPCQGSGALPPPQDVDALVHVVRSLADEMKRRLEAVRFLSSLRGTALMHDDVGPDVAFVGRHGEMTVRLLSKVQSRTNPQFEALRRWAAELGLPGLEAGWAGGEQLKITFRDPTSGTPLTVEEAASGSRQAVVLAAQLLLTAPGSTLLIEEPEVNMHPAFEKLLAKLLAESVSAGHQLIVCTHSEVLVAALANVVRNRHAGLKPSSLAIWHLERDSAGHVAGRRLQVSRRGYLDEWVKSFASVEQELMAEWANGLPEERPTTRG